VCSTVQRRQSPERPILCQISSLTYAKIQRRQIVTNVLHQNCALPPRWSPPVLCILIHDGWKWWLVANATDVGISEKVVPANIQDSWQAPSVHCINPLYICLVNCPAFRLIKHYQEHEDPVQVEFGSCSLSVTSTSVGQDSALLVSWYCACISPDHCYRTSES